MSIISKIKGEQKQNNSVAVDTDKLPEINENDNEKELEQADNKIEEILLNHRQAVEDHEARITELEAALFRLRSI